MDRPLDGDSGVQQRTMGSCSAEIVAAQMKIALTFIRTVFVHTMTAWMNCFSSQFPLMDAT